MEIVKKLMVHIDKAEGSHYRDELLSKIIEICSQSNYQFITNFEWYDTSHTLPRLLVAIVTQRRSVAMNGGCFHWNLFVSVFVCLSTR